MADCMTQEDAMNMSIEQAIEILVPMRDMMLDQNGCPISDAYFALDKVIKYAERRGNGGIDMADLIDRGKAIQSLYGITTNAEGTIPFRAAVFAIRHTPSAERRGKWIDRGKDWLNCSVCDEPVRKLQCDTLLRNDSYYHYCPNCGAKMEV